jgi:C1A family cysteine protease
MAFAEPLASVAEQMPETFSLRDEMPMVYDQGQLGSCTANAIAALLQFANIQAGTDFGIPSRLFIYFCERVREGTVTQDAGAYGRDGFASLRKAGAPPETVWPYVIDRFAQVPSDEAYTDAAQHKIKHYTHARRRESEVCSLVYGGKPVAFGMSVPQCFEGEQCMTTGVMPEFSKGESFIGGHEMCIIGWKPGYYEVRNSWGPNVMDKGHVWIPIDFLFGSAGGYASDFRAIEAI